jgi:hypothetical protein
MISPPAPHAHPDIPSRIWRPTLETLPRKMRIASVVAGALVLGSLILTTLIAAHLGTHTLVYPPPTIQITLANAGAAIHPSDTVRFSVTAIAGRQLTYKWGFGDGASATGAQVSHAYATYGYFVVSVSAVDPTGQHTSSQTTVTVVPPAPQAKIAVSHDRAYNYIVTVNASASTGTDLHYFWDFGDGASSTSGLDQKVTHYYLHPGTYGVTLTVVDVAGQRDTTIVQVTVSAVSYH